MSVILKEFKSYSGTERTGIGANSVDTTTGDCFVSISGNIVSKATSSTVIAGVSITQKVFASDNQTVAKAPLNYTPTDVDNIYAVTITGGTITVADEGKFYNLSDSVTVDGTTESTVGVYTNTSDGGSATDPLLHFQLQMVKFVSATNSYFRIVTKV